MSKEAENVRNHTFNYYPHSFLQTDIHALKMAKRRKYYRKKLAFEWTVIKQLYCFHYLAPHQIEPHQMQEKENWIAGEMNTEKREQTTNLNPRNHLFDYIPSLTANFYHLFLSPPPIDWFLYDRNLRHEGVKGFMKMF